MQDHLNDHLYSLIIEEKFPFKIYHTYLKEMSSQFYEEYHEAIFYVDKEKVINLYHMI